MRRIALQALFSSITAFMVTGSLAREHLLYYCVPPEKIFLFPYAVDNQTIAERCRVYKEQRDILRAELGISPDNIVVLSVIKFVPREGAFDLLKAYALLVNMHPELSLILVGDGEQRQLLIDFVQEYRVPKVIFAGYQPYSLLPKYYALADIFVHPAINEPWGFRE